jgi:hypothetical protein
MKKSELKALILECKQELAEESADAEQFTVGEGGYEWNVTYTEDVMTVDVDGKSKVVFTYKSGEGTDVEVTDGGTFSAALFQLLYSLKR